MTSLQQDVDVAHQFWDDLDTKAGASGVDPNLSVLDTQTKYPDDVWAQICEGLESIGTITVTHLQHLDVLHLTTLILTELNAIYIQGFWDWYKYWNQIMDTSVLLIDADDKDVCMFAESNPGLLQQYVCAVLSVLTDLKYSVMILALKPPIFQLNLLVSLKWEMKLGMALLFAQREILDRVFHNPQVKRYITLMPGGDIPYVLALLPAQSPSVPSNKPTPKPPKPLKPPDPLNPLKPPTPTDSGGGGMGILFIILLLLAVAVTFSKK